MDLMASTASAQRPPTIPPAQPANKRSSVSGGGTWGWHMRKLGHPLPPSFGSLARLCHSILNAPGVSINYCWQVACPGVYGSISPSTHKINISVLIRL